MMVRHYPTADRGKADDNLMNAAAQEVQKFQIKFLVISRHSVAVVCPTCFSDLEQTDLEEYLGQL